MIVLRLSGNAVPEHFRYLEHRSSLCNSATSRSISSLILPLDFILVFYCSTMISRHNRVGTLFFATAEFIFDDWHRFLGVVVGIGKRKKEENKTVFLLLALSLFYYGCYGFTNGGGVPRSSSSFSSTDGVAGVGAGVGWVSV